MTSIRTLVGFLALVLTVSVPTAAKGQSRETRKAPKKAEQAKVIRVEEMKVEGRIQKPQAMFLMPRANLSVRDLERSEPFLPKVVEALEKEPF